MTDEFVEICPAEGDACPWDATQKVESVGLVSKGGGKSVTLRGADAHVADAHPELIRSDWATAGEIYTRDLWAQYKRADS